MDINQFRICIGETVLNIKFFIILYDLSHWLVMQFISLILCYNYSKWSCYNYWENITVPIVFINAIDDPIIPPKLVEKVKTFVMDQKVKTTTGDSSMSDRLLIEQKYGGHLGFHEGGFINPNTLTWLDRYISTVT